MSNKPVQTYKFGDLVVQVQGLGVYVGGEHLQCRLAALDRDALKSANREAWRQRRAAEKVAARCNNVSVHGWNDRLDQLIEVASVVCRETWKRLQS